MICFGDTEQLSAVIRLILEHESIACMNLALASASARVKPSPKLLMLQLSRPCFAFRATDVILVLVVRDA